MTLEGGRLAGELERLLRCGTATVGEVNPDAQVAEFGLRPLAPDMEAAGPALAVRCRPGDNLALHLAIARIRPGEVLVVDYGGDLGSGPFGEIMALACQQRGAAALVIDGAVRDSRQIARMGFPVFCRGINICGTAKRDAGAIGEAVRVGGATVATGDIVLADADAVLAFPPSQLDETLRRAAERAAKEEQVMARLRRGETTLQIFDLQRQED